MITLYSQLSYILTFAITLFNYIKLKCSETNCFSTWECMYDDYQIFKWPEAIFSIMKQWWNLIQRDKDSERIYE